MGFDEAPPASEDVPPAFKKSRRAGNLRKRDISQIEAEEPVAEGGTKPG